MGNAVDAGVKERIAADPPESGDWHLRSVGAVFEELGTSEEGLGSDEARTRLDRYGRNVLEERAKTSALKRLLLQFHDPLIYVLLGTAAITAVLAHWVDTGVILGVVVVNAIIGFIQESKAEQAIESLKEMLSPEAIVRRDGRKGSVQAAELVPGDVVLLQSGDKVPADLRLCRVKNLQIDEAALTGESVPVEKTADDLEGDVSLGDRRNMAFAGTLVTTGTAESVVVATGDRTQLGQIAGMLQDVEGVDTPLVRRLAVFSKAVTVAVIVFCVLAFGLGVLAGRGAVEMLMASVALAVSAIPEGLPAIMTIALAIGVKRMARRNAVVRRLPAVEALGSTTVICTDKTGTLTRNEMMVARIVSADSRYTVTGDGYDPGGEVLDDDRNEVVAEEGHVVHSLARAAALCNDADLRHVEGQWKIDGDPTEAALLVLAEKVGLPVADLAERWQRVDEIPFESELQYMATLHHDGSGGAAIFLKGSPETVLSRCAREWQGADPLDVDRWNEAAETMATEGLRVLAIAEKEHEPGDTDLDFDDTERDFSLLGLVGLVDPPRQEAIEAVAKCHEAGIRVKMITGDHAATAQAIAKQVGIIGDGEPGRAVTGTELETLDESEFDEIVAEYDVFARVSPAQKLGFVQSLQRQGEIVAMTGDGVNDAPALKQADIGVAMGVTGTEVAKEAAEMVLLDDNFASIERAVEEGRTVFDNLRKTILFILPTNGGECLTLVAALLLGMLLPILPLHILWINLVTTVALAITLAFDPVDPNVMHRPPRDPQGALVGRWLVWRIVYVSVLMSLGTFGLFYYERNAGSSVEIARAVAVNAIVFFEVAYVFNSRHLTDSILNRRGFTGNPFVWWGVAAVVVLQALFTYWPLLAGLFHVGPMDAWMWARVLGAAVALLFLVEGEKAVSRRILSGRRRAS